MGDQASVVCIASWNTDLTAHVARPIARGETLLATAFNISPGGKGSNAAVAAARQGVRVALVTRIGDDDFGRMGMALWLAEGIAYEQVERAAGERSGVAQILVYDDGDNSIAVCPGAGAGLNAGHIDKARALIESASVVMSSCEVPLVATQAAFQIARAVSVTTLLNPAPACDLPRELLSLVDVLTPNETELHQIAGLGSVGSIDDAATALLQRGVGAVLVTLGSVGCKLYRPHTPAVTVAGHTMQVADTIGAGDTFTGTLAAALAQGEALVDAMRWANKAAALSVMKHGAVAGIPTRADVLAFSAPN